MARLNTKKFKGAFEKAIIRQGHKAARAAAKAALRKGIEPAPRIPAETQYLD